MHDIVYYYLVHHFSTHSVHLAEPEPNMKNATLLAPVFKDFVDLVARGDIEYRCGIDSFSGGSDIEFADGKTETYDVILFSTGYHTDFSFLASELQPRLECSGERRPMMLYKHMFHPRHPSLSFLGMTRLSAAAWPISELQARVVAAVATERIALPASDVMVADAHHGVSSKVEMGWANPLLVDALYYGDELAAMIGAKPSAFRNLSVLKPLMIGMVCPTQYRLNGLGAWDVARKHILDVHEQRDITKRGADAKDRKKPSNGSSRKLIVVLTMSLLVLMYILWYA
jgi:hypothetical protein